LIDQWWTRQRLRRVRHEKKKKNDVINGFVTVHFVRTVDVTAIVRVKSGFQLNATHATQSIALRALRALRKRKPQETQAYDWLL